MRHQGEVPAEFLSQAQSMLAAGASWNRIQKTIGFSSDKLRRRLDPEWAALRRTRVRENRSSRVGVSLNHTVVFHISPADAAKALSTVPPDTRPRTARLMGDPLPGRSALDQRKSSSSGLRAAIPSTFSTLISVAHKPLGDFSR